MYMYILCFLQGSVCLIAILVFLLYRPWNIISGSPHTPLLTPADGTLLPQFDALVVGLAVCLKGGTVFYVDLTHPDSYVEIQSRLQAISSVLCKDSEKVADISPIFIRKSNSLQ